MTRARLACLFLSLPLLLLGCPRPGGPVKVAAAPEEPAKAPRPWRSDASRLPAGSAALGTVQVSLYFPLFEAFGRHHGQDAVMSAWQVPHLERTWWVVDTRYTFPTEDDAARFLTSQLAQLAEGHPLIEPRLTLPCDRAARLFAGRIVHPGLGTPFLALVVTGRHERHVYKFLAAVELAGEETPDLDERLRADFLSLAAMALVP